VLQLRDSVIASSLGGWKQAGAGTFSLSFFPSQQLPIEDFSYKDLRSHFSMNADNLSRQQCRKSSWSESLPRSEENLMTSSGRNLGPWLRRPLCRRYVLGIFDASVVRLRDADGFRDHPVHWAFGWLADGECEPLGAWIGSESGAGSPLQMLADLKDRGVERIWHVTGTGVGRLQECVSAVFPGATVHTSVDRRLTEALATSRPRAPLSPELAAEQVRENLVHAIRRRSSFESEAAVLDFIAGALQRAERRLDRERVMAAVMPQKYSAARIVPPGL
jgi:hypothetical protein